MKLGQTADQLERKGILVAPASAFLPEGKFSHRPVRRARNLLIVPNVPLLVSSGITHIREAIIVTKFKVFTLMLPLLFASSQVCAQAITEYGKVLGNAKERQGNANSKASRGVKQRGNAKGVVQGMADVPSIPLPSSLTTEAKGTALHARHDESSDAITHLFGGEKLAPLAETAAGNDHWYMVRTQTGLVGWVKSTEVVKEANRTTGQ